jgi:hypothetical protein
MKKINLLGLFLLIFASVSMMGQNLVQNPGMENWDDDATPSSWDKAENISKETINIHGGTYSAAHMSASSTMDLSQDVTGIVGGQQYRIQYYYLDNSPTARTRIWSYWMDVDGNYLDDNADVLRPSDYSVDSPDWGHFDETLTAPSTAAQFRFEVRVYKQDGMTDGYVYYDDFSLEADITNNPEPSNYPTDFTATAEGITINLNWTDAVGDVLPVGYLIKGEVAPVSSSANIDYPVDGTPEADDLDWSDGTGTVNVAYGVENYTFSGLTPGEIYVFYIFPYSNSGDNIDYKTDGDVPVATAQLPAIIILNQEDFDNGLGTWTPYNVLGVQEWYQSDFGGKTFAKMSGYDGGAFDNEDWLISPVLNMADFDSVFFNFESAYNYTGPALQLFISNDYDGAGNPNDFSWTDISDMAVWSDGSWNFVGSGDVSLNDYLQDGVYLAFKFTSTTDGSATWELDSFLVFGYIHVGLDENAFASIQLFPNPAHQQLFLTSNTDASISIYTINGQKLMETSIIQGDNAINISTLQSGMYVVQVKAQNGETLTKKLLVE